MSKRPFRLARAPDALDVLVQWKRLVLSPFLGLSNLYLLINNSGHAHSVNQQTISKHPVLCPVDGALSRRRNHSVILLGGAYNLVREISQMTDRTAHVSLLDGSRSPTEHCVL